MNKKPFFSKNYLFDGSSGSRSLFERLSRRELLLGGLGVFGLGLFGALDPLRRMVMAEGEAAADMHYIFCYFSGGWDILLSLDPRDPEVFTEDRLQETLIQPGYDRLENPSNDGKLIETEAGITFGPHIGDLALHADKLTLVRGISMETLTHATGRRRFLTGRPPSGTNPRGSSFSTWLASLFGAELILPNVSLKVESFNLDQPSYASAMHLENVEDLLRALRPGEATLSEEEEAQIEALLEDFAACSTVQASSFWQRAEEARLKAGEVIDRQLADLFDFSAETEEMAALRDHYGIGTGSGALKTPEAQAAAAVTAITEGLSRCVSVELASGLDTHYEAEWASEQGPEQENGFTLMARIIEDLASRPYGEGEQSWLDHTIVVGFSEFSRTALLNDAGGRDHSLTNACVLCGGRLRKGVVLGASSDVGMAPLALNLASGEVDSEGEVVVPESIWRALLVDAGIEEDVADFRVDPLRALFEG